MIRRCVKQRAKRPSTANPNTAWTRAPLERRELGDKSQEHAEELSVLEPLHRSEYPCAQQRKYRIGRQRDRQESRSSMRKQFDPEKGPIEGHCGPVARPIG